jgi:diguanylate cyclase (GGDEF)-like protein/PAS domain S-box-containing protein
MMQDKAAEDSRLLLVCEEGICAPLGDALKADYVLDRVSEFEDAFGLLLQHSYAALLVEENLVEEHPESVRERLARMHCHAPVIILAKGNDPVPSKLIGELNAYHALPYTGRDWDYVARSIVDVLGQRDLERDNALLRNVVEHASDCIIAVDPEGHVQHVNGAVVRTFGYARTELHGTLLTHLFPYDSGRSKDEDVYSAFKAGEQWCGEVEAQRRDGSSFPVHLALSFVRDYEGNVSAGILIARDVTDLQRLLGRLTELSLVDELTGVYNVRYFWARFRYELMRSRRYKQPLAVLMMDLDRFKVFNETYGHQVGDRVLHHVAEVMGSVTREVDLLARYGGEEFVLVLPSTELEGALQCAENLRNSVETTPLHEGGQDLKVTVSIGIACMEQGIADEEELLKRADDALRMAKQLGRNQVRTWHPGDAEAVKGGG